MDIDFHYGLDLDYDTYTDCDSGCDPYCRCGVIQNVRIRKPCPASLVECVLLAFRKGILEKKDPRKKDPIFLYCLERVLARYKADDFHVHIAHGYYGEEVEKVVLEDSRILDDFLTLSNSQEWVEAALTAEYGYVLPRLKNLTWAFETVDIQDVKVGNEYRKLDRDKVLTYMDFLKSYPEKKLSCLVDSNLRLIDGYHRLQASTEAGRKVIEAIKPVETKE